MLAYKNFRTYFFMYVAFIFSERITFTSFEEALKLCHHSIFQEVWTEGSIACTLPI